MGRKVRIRRKNKKINFPGSLIVQNFGESVHKGWVKWDINLEKGTTNSVKLIEIPNDYAYYTIVKKKDGSYPTCSEIPKYPIVRVFVPGIQLTASEIKQIENEVKKKYNPSEIRQIQGLGDRLTVESYNNIKVDLDIDDIQSPSIQNEYIRNYYSDILEDDVIEKIIQLNNKYQPLLTIEEITRNVRWQLNKIEFDNFGNYKEKNELRFDKYRGVTGIVGENYIGKSTLFFSLMFNIFKATSHPSLNIEDIINKRKTRMKLWCEITIGLEKYFIKRTFKYVTHKNRKTGQFEKSISSRLNYYKQTSDGKTHILNGDTSQETEIRIRRLFGTAEYFKLTAYSQQNNSLELIDNKRGKEKKEILSKFLGLDVFSNLKEIAKQYYDDIERETRHFDIDKIEKTIKSQQHKIEITTTSIKKIQEKLNDLNDVEKLCIEELNKLKESLHLIDKELMNLNEEDIKKELQYNHLEIRKYNNTKKSLSTERDSLNLTIEKIKKATLLFSKLSKTMETVRKVQQNIYDNENRQKLLQVELTQIDKEIEILNEQPWCRESKCIFLQNALNAEKQKPIIENKINKINEETNNLKKWIKSKDIEIKKHNILLKLQEEMQNIKDKFVSVQQQIIKLELNIKKTEYDKTILKTNLTKLINNKKNIIENKNLQQKIQIKQDEINNIQLQINSNIKEHTTLTAINDQLKKDIIEKEEQYNKYKESQIEYKLLKYYIKAVDVDGIPLNIIRSVLPIINIEINKLLVTMNFSVELEMNTQGTEIFTYIVDERSKKKIESGSGAEKMLAGLAIRCALISLSSLPKPNFIIIDEGFGSLDSTNLNNLGKLFEQLKQQFEHVFIISHISDVLDFCDNQIVVSLDKNGYSIIQE